MATPIDLPIRLPEAWEGILNLYHDPRGRRTWHRHDDAWEFNLVVEGSGHYDTGNGPIQLSAGTLLVFPPGSAHFLANVTPGLSLWVVSCRAANVARWLPQHNEAAIGMRQLAAAEGGDLARLCAQVHACADHAATMNAGLAFLVLAIRRLLKQRVPSGDAQHPAVREAQRLLHQQPGLGLAALALRTNLGRQRLGHLFQAQTGTDLIRWRNNLRLDRAMQLASDGCTMRVAAQRAGFGSYAQFHRVFRQRQGQSPRQWAAGLHI